jgi:hypothetical protein
MFYNNSTGEITYGNTISVAGNITGGNILTGGLISATGNLTSGNVNTVIVSATGQIVSTASGNAATGAGQIYLNGATNNRIDFNTNGTGAPATTTRSDGTKLLLYPTLSNSLVDYAIGIDSATMWSSVPENSAGFNFKWYGATTQVASLSGTGVMSVLGNITGANLLTGGLISATGNVTGGNLITAGSGGNITLTGGNITGANVITANAVSTTGNITAANFFGNGNTLSNVATTFESTWTVPVGNSTQSFTVNSGTYSMWVDCNITNGILVWNATATVTNTNVPVVGAQYAWVYNGGGTPIDFTSIPNQFTGTANTIVRSNTAPSSTTNRFDFGINNTSGGNVTVRYGWVQIS